MRSAGTDPQIHEVEVEGENGRYTGRITGREIDCVDSVSVYLTDDERVIVYDANPMSVEKYESTDEALLDLEPGTFVAAYKALGVQPVVDL